MNTIVNSDTDLHLEDKPALEAIFSQVSQQSVIVFVSGNFNIVHPGHLRLLQYAAERGDYLVVGVHSDNTAKGVVIRENERLEGVKAITWVNKAFILHDTPQNFIKFLKPQIVVKGREHEAAINPELPVIESYGGKLLFSSGESIFTSLDLIKDEIKEINFNTIKPPVDYLVRHGITNSNLINRIKSFSNLKVCVIGDTIIDEYIKCDPVGMSQEDPTIVVRPVHKEIFLGGASIVAGHAFGLGSQINYFTVIGNDENGKYAIEEFKKYGLNAHYAVDATRPTTRKTRYRASGKTLLRVNEFSQQQINKIIQNEIIDSIIAHIESSDLIIFSDFNYGVLPQILVDHITEYVSKHEIMLAADSQSSSQIGDISRFKGMTLITPTENEVRISTRDHDSGLIALLEKLSKQSDIQHIILTLAEEGVLLHTKVDNENKWITDRLPAFNKSPKDPAGAGDALLVGSSLTLAAGGTIWESVYIGSLAAACQVGRVGNIPLTANELIMELNIINI